MVPGMDTKPTVIAIIDTLGAETLCARFEVTNHAVRAARVAGSFPASWYATLDVMCAEAGIECPREAFNWKGVAA